MRLLKRIKRPSFIRRCSKNWSNRGGSAGIFGLFKKEAKVKLVPLDEDYNKEEAVELAKATKEELRLRK